MKAEYTYTGQLVLASASPRRAALLHEHGYDFTVEAATIDEPTSIPGIDSPDLFAMELSRLKAHDVAQHHESAIILAADTLACQGTKIFGKPTDRDDARRILKSIMGTTHHVITGMTLLNTATMSEIVACDTTSVTMRELSDEEMETYLDSDAWEGKAGAYGIQDHGDKFVTEIQGSYSNVVGLPLELLAEMLSNHVAS